MAWFGNAHDKYSKVKDAVTGNSATNGAADEEAEIIPDQFNRVWRQVNIEKDLGFGRKDETKEERWARDRETIADVRASRERNSRG